MDDKNELVDVELDDAHKGWCVAMPRRRRVCWPIPMAARRQQLRQNRTQPLHSQAQFADGGLPRWPQQGTFGGRQQVTNWGLPHPVARASAAQRVAAGDEAARLEWDVRALAGGCA
eukprot:364183-Chlamydomonas_euryale.AAC.12